MSYISNLANRVNNIEAKDNFNLKEIDIEKLVPSQNNFYGIREIEQLAASIKESGLMHNLVVRKIDHDKYEILSGERRYRALKSLNVKKVPCQVKELNDIDSELLLIKANAEQRELTANEKMEAVKRLEELYKKKRSNGEQIPKGKLRDIIGKDIGLSGTQVGRYQKIDKKVIESLKDNLDKGDITLTQAETLSKLNAEEQKQMNERIEDIGPDKAKDEIDILIQGIKQPVERKEDKELIHEMYEADKQEDVNESSYKDELLEALKIDPFPRFFIYTGGIFAMLRVSEITFQDTEEYNLKVKLSGFGVPNVLNFSLKEFKKVDRFPNKLKPKHGYKINDDVYLWFKDKESDIKWQSMREEEDSHINANKEGKS